MHTLLLRSKQFTHACLKSFYNSQFTTQSTEIHVMVQNTITLGTFP